MALTARQCRAAVTNKVVVALRHAGDGIARTLIRDNPILILDHPTAALDAESEELVIEALERLMADRT